jgi:hypothetical protein
MSNPDEVAKLREIKRLLDRIQQLPHIAAAGAGNGVHNGYLAGSLHSPAADDGNGVHDGYYADSRYAPAAGNGVYNGFHADVSDAPATAASNGAHGGLYPQARPSSAVEHDPEPPPFPAGSLSSLAFREERHIGEARALVPIQTSATTGISPWVFVTATAVNTIIAAVLAVVITLGVGRRESGEVAPAAMAGKEDARTAAKPKHLAEPVLVRPIDLLPIGSRSEPLRLEAMKPSRFPLEVRPEEAMQASYILVLTGLPANATLSGATRMGSDSWLMAPGALRQLEITVPEWSASVIELGVELRHANGTVAAQGKAWLAVPPPPVPQGAKLDQTAIKDLLQRGDRLLGRGDVAAARAVYERAAALGSAQAALVLGSTYDPGRLWSLGVFGMVGSKERARHWYQRADQLGHPEAKDRLKALRN